MFVVGALSMAFQVVLGLPGRQLKQPAIAAPHGAPSNGLIGVATHMIAATPLEALILEQTAEAVVYANRDGVIERWNAAATAMFGYPPAEVLGQSLDVMIPEHLRRAHWRGFDAAMANAKTRLGGRPTLTRGLHKSGKKLYLEMSFALVLDDAGSPLGSVAVARDVTERVAREKAAAGSAEHS